MIETRKQQRALPMRVRLSDGSTFDIEVRTSVVCTVMPMGGRAFNALSPERQVEVQRIMAAQAEAESW